MEADHTFFMWGVKNDLVEGGTALQGFPFTIQVHGANSSKPSKAY